MTKTTEIPDRYSPGWMGKLDQRTSLAQELSRRHRQLCDDLGGLPALSYQQRALTERALFLELHLQTEEAKLANGEDFDSGRWVQACNALTGVLKTLGLERRARDVPSLPEYLAQQGSAQ